MVYCVKYTYVCIESYIVFAARSAFIATGVRVMALSSDVPLVRFGVHSFGVRSHHAIIFLVIVLLSVIVFIAVAVLVAVVVVAAIGSHSLCVPVV